MSCPLPDGYGPSTPNAIVPRHKTEQPNQKLDLYDGEMEIETIRGVSPGRGTLHYVWEPSPTIQVFAAFGVQQAVDDRERASFRFKVQGANNFEEVRLPTYGTNPGQPFGAYGFGHSSGTVVGSPQTVLQSTKFHVPNFLSFAGELIRYDYANPPMGKNARAKIIYRDWQIILDAVAEYDVFRQWDLERKAVSGLTHVGEITKVDGRNYTAADMMVLLDRLATWFSFCRGNWTAPILAVGLSNDGREVWKDWRSHYVRPSVPVTSWATTSSADFLETGFNKFCALHLNPAWKDAARLAIHWYVECVRQASGVEAAIILAQTGLELLAWTYLVEDLKVVSHDGLEKLPAADKFRVLLMKCNIALEIPTNLSRLVDFAGQMSLHDGPECLVRVRNVLVHSGKKHRKMLDACSAEIRTQIWTLSLWYFELVLLRVLGYVGTYRNRLVSECRDVSSVAEPLPWANL